MPRRPGAKPKAIHILLPSALSPTVWWAPKTILQVQVSVHLLCYDLASLRLCVEFQLHGSGFELV